MHGEALEDSNDKGCRGRLTGKDRAGKPDRLKRAATLGKRELEAGESTTLKITAYREQLAKAHGRPRVLMITNDPDRPKVVIKIKTK